MEMFLLYRVCVANVTVPMRAAFPSQPLQNPAAQDTMTFPSQLSCRLKPFLLPGVRPTCAPLLVQRAVLTSKP